MNSSKSPLGDLGVFDFLERTHILNLIYSNPVFWVDHWYFCQFCNTFKIKYYDSFNKRILQSLSEYLFVLIDKFIDSRKLF